jgi:hypothetical protein
MSVPARDSLPDLADKPASGPLEPQRTELTNGARADMHLGWLTGSVGASRRLAENPRQIEPICAPQAISAEAIQAAPNQADLALEP